MPTSNVTHFVFVDFENTQTVALGLVEGKPVQVSLLIGKKQTRLDLPLVQQIRRFADQVELIEVGASGHNALDLTLAFHLGQAGQRFPAADFAIVSRDKDFDALIAHLRAKGMKAARYESFAALPLFARAKQPVPGKSPVEARDAPARTTAALKPSAAAARSPLANEKITRLGDHLRRNHPKTLDTVLRSIATFYAGKLAPADVARVLETLKQQNVLTIDAGGKVGYR